VVSGSSGSPEGTVRSGSLRLAALVAGTAALAAAGLLAGCGAGQVAQTANIVPAVGGANLDLRVDGGVISVRDATLAYPGPEGYRAGEDAPLALRIVNSTSSPITLTGVSADAGTVRQVGGSAATEPSPQPPSTEPSTGPSAATGPSALPSGAAPSGSAAAPGSPASAEPTAAPSPSGPPGSATIDVPVPGAPNGLIILNKTGAEGTYLLVSGLTKGLRAGESVRLILTFTLADGGTVQMGASDRPEQELNVPVAVPDEATQRSPMSLAPAEG
jgi:hypothetical protein